MSKNVRWYVFFAIFFIGVGLTSCKNFLNSQDFLTQLEESIFYANQDFFEIRFTGNGGKISPSGMQPCRITDQFTLIFSEDPEMCFINWQVMLNGEVLDPETSASYITFDDIEAPETKIHINARTAGLEIKPLVAQRPKVVKASPQSDAQGVFSGTQIEVVFTQNIDESSIYWTQNELEELGVPVSLATPVPEKTDSYYRYWDGSDPNTYQYKIVTVKNFLDSDINYLQYLSYPLLDPTNTKKLIIPLQDALPTFEEVIVTIKKCISTTKYNKNIGLNEDYSWTYNTDNSIDTTGPVFITDDKYAFSITVTDDNQTSYIERPCLPTDKDLFLILSTDSFEEKIHKQNIIINSYANNLKLWIKGGFMDDGMGISKASYEFKVLNRIQGNEFKDVQVGIQITKENELPLTFIGNKALLNPKQLTSKETGGLLLDFSDIYQGMDSISTKQNLIYCITIKLFDKNDNKTEKKFYFGTYLQKIQKFTGINNDIEISCSNDGILLKNIEKPNEEVDQNGNQKYTAPTIGRILYKNVFISPGETYLDKGNYVIGTDYTITYSEQDLHGNINPENKVKTVTCKPSAGNYYYTDGSFTHEFDKSRTPVGIVLTATQTNDNKIDVRLLKTDELKLAKQFENSGKIVLDTNTITDGYEVYTKAEEKLSALNNTIWDYLINTFNKDTNILWYIPTVSEFQLLYDNKTELNSKLKVLEPYCNITFLGENNENLTCTTGSENTSQSNSLVILYRLGDNTLSHKSYTFSQEMNYRFLGRVIIQ